MQPTTLDLHSFADSVFREWVDGSAIKPELFAANVEVVADETIENGGEINYPIHEALNWNPAKWRTVWQSGKQQRPELFGALIHSWNPLLAQSEVFQVKLSNPLIDQKKGKPRKYENPAKRGQVGGFALVTQSIWQSVADRYGIEVDFSALPDAVDFWSWVVEHPEIPIFICEGMKKACCLLSHGYVAIALSGITMGRTQRSDGKLALQPYLAMFANPLLIGKSCSALMLKPRKKLNMMSFWLRSRRASYLPMLAVRFGSSNCLCWKVLIRLELMTSLLSVVLRLLLRCMWLRFPSIPIVGNTNKIAS